MRPVLVALAALAALVFVAAIPASAQRDTAVEPFIWTDPDTQCAYLVAPGAGLTPRLRREGVPDCPDADVQLSESFERTLRQGGEALGRALQDLGREMERERVR